MILFFNKNYLHLKEVFSEFSSAVSGEYETCRFPNNEMFIRVKTIVTNENCFIIGSIIPPEDNFMELALLIHTLKKESARSVSVILPYFAYSRHDKNKHGESLALACLGSLLKTAGANEIITIDMHSKKGSDLIPLPVFSLSPAKIFAEALQKERTDGYVIVSPDEGSLERCEGLREIMKISNPIAYFVKKRTEAGMTMEGPVGNIEKRIILFDDILDTGETLILTCKRLKELGATDIIIAVTHGLFIGEKWKELWNLNVKKIYCSDTIRPKEKDSPFEKNMITINLKPLYESFFAERNANTK